MRIPFILVGILAFAATYADSNSIIGSWKLQSAQGERSNQAPSSLSYTFNADMTCAMSFQAKDGSTKTAQWTYEIKDQTIYMRLVGSTKLPEVSTYSIVGDTLTMKNRQESVPTLVFNKVR